MCDAMCEIRSVILGILFACGLIWLLLHDSQEQTKWSSRTGKWPKPTRKLLAQSYGALADIQTFSASGTWTKPTTGILVRVICIGGGRDGGIVDTTYSISLLPETVAVTVGRGDSTFGSILTAVGSGSGGSGFCSVITY